MQASMHKSVFHITLKASHTDESQNTASLLTFAFTWAVCSAQAGLRQLRTQLLCTRVGQQGFLSHVRVSRTQNLLSLSCDMPQQHLWGLRHRDHLGENPAQKAVPVVMGVGFTELHIN